MITLLKYMLIGGAVVGSLIGLIILTGVFFGGFWVAVLLAFYVGAFLGFIIYDNKHPKSRLLNNLLGPY